MKQVPIGEIEPKGRSLPFFGKKALGVQVAHKSVWVKVYPRTQVEERQVDREPLDCAPDSGVSLPF